MAAVQTEGSGRSARQKIQIKVVVIGELGVGKTSMVEWFVYKEKPKKPKRPKSEPIRSRLGQEIIVDKAVVCMNLWDTAGQERYRSLTASYYRGAHGGMIVFDVSQNNSFDSVTLWYKDLKEYCSNSEHISAVLVGTVSTSRTREVTTERAQTLAEHIGIPYLEVDLETGDNINEAFQKLGELVVETLKRYPNALTRRDISTTISTQTEKNKSSFCAC